MHNSTLIVLVILTIGQMLMMAFGAFILWLMGDLGGSPWPTRRDASSHRKNLVEVPQEAVKMVEEDAHGLIRSGEEESIAPETAEKRADQEPENHDGHPAGKAA